MSHLPTPALQCTKTGVFLFFPAATCKFNFLQSIVNLLSIYWQSMVNLFNQSKTWILKYWTSDTVCLRSADSSSMKVRYSPTFGFTKFKYLWFHWNHKVSSKCVSWNMKVVSNFPSFSFIVFKNSKYEKERESEKREAYVFRTAMVLPATILQMPHSPHFFARAWNHNKWRGRS